MEFSESSVGKKYRTRVDTEVIIYSVYGAGEFPIHGAYNSGQGWVIAAWAANGSSSNTGRLRSLDIVREA